MQLSYGGRLFLEEQEGFKSFAYKDTAGVWTIGYGTTMINGKPILPGMTCTMQEANSWVDADTAKVQTSINRSVKVPINQNMFDALVSFTYNEGIPAFEGSTLLKLINSASFKDAAWEFPKWDKEHVGGVLKASAGLHARRMREKALFETK